MVEVVFEALTVFVELFAGDLAVVLGECEHFVSSRLDGAGLVRVDVRALRAYDACVLRGNGAEHGLVRLCASHEEPDVGLCGITGFANLVCGRIAILVLAIAGVLFVRHGLHAGDDLRGGGGGIIVFERQHMHSCSLWLRAVLLCSLRPGTERKHHCRAR